MLYFSRWTTHPTQWLINSVSLMDGKAEKEWRCHRIIRYKFLDQIRGVIWWLCSTKFHRKQDLDFMEDIVKYWFNACVARYSFTTTCEQVHYHETSGYMDQIIELIWISRSSEHSKYSSWHVIPSSTHRWCVSSMNVWLISTWLRLIYNCLINWTDIIIPHTVTNDIITCIRTIAWIPS
jgi:hypothetical protein